MIQTGACVRHRDALASLAEGFGPTPTGLSAIEHLDRCADCNRLLGELTLTVIALRRVGAEAEVASRGGSDDAWANLRVRIERSGRRAREQAWRWRTTLGSLATAGLLVAAVVGPAAVHLTNTGSSEMDPGFASALLDRLDIQLERASLNADRKSAVGGLTGTSDAVDGRLDLPTWHPAGEEGDVAIPRENGTFRRWQTGF